MRRLAVVSLSFARHRWMRQMLAACGWQVVGPWARADAVGLWGQRLARRARILAAKRGLPLVTIEESLIRSPMPTDPRPLGLILDEIGLYTNAAHRSGLDARLDRPLSKGQTARACAAMEQMRTLRLSKYNPPLRGNLPEPGYILVVDQCPGDRAIASGGADASSFARMYDTARAEHPGRPVLVRRHPRGGTGHLPNAPALPTEIGVWDALEAAHTVYCVTSQMGFEAILAGHRPVCFGAGFYAGRGLTDDRILITRSAAPPEALFHRLMIDMTHWISDGKPVPLEQAMTHMAKQRNRPA